MRGSAKDLKNIEDNAKEFRNIFIRMFIGNMLVLFLYLRNGYTLVTFLKRSVLENICLFLTYRKTRPLIVEEKEGVFKVMYCRSINDGGVPAALVDTASFLVAAKCLVVFSYIGAIFVLCFIPVSFVVELIYKPYKKVTQGDALNNEKLVKKLHEKNK